jgi:single-strand DNA-binding protein
MAATNINRVIITGNLTSDPELRSLPSGTSVCKLRVACNTRRKDASSGEWVDKPNYFDVTVWGAQGENCARYLSKGRPVAVDGRLEWREWETGQQKRQAVSVVADTVQFLDGPRERSEDGADDDGGGGGDAGTDREPAGVGAAGTDGLTF